MQAVCRSLGDSPLVGLFQAGYAELTAQLRQTAPTASRDGQSAARPPRVLLSKSLTAVDRALMRASAVEVNKLEQPLPFLATTASIAPFIGLFGTVVGHHDRRFRASARPARPTSASSAPGIAEALVATAAGLVAAIPAVYFYNHLTQPREAVRVGDGRLRDGVPEHRRAELHVTCRRSKPADSTPPGRARPRPPRVDSSLAEINVVPLVDVMLVLLIIFMVTAPMIQRGVDVEPAGRARARSRSTASACSSPCRSPIGRTSMVFLGDEPMRVDVLAGAHPPEDGDREPTRRSTCAATAACSFRN